MTFYNEEIIANWKFDNNDQICSTFASQNSMECHKITFCEAKVRVEGMVASVALPTDLDYVTVRFIRER